MMEKLQYRALWLGLLAVGLTACTPGNNGFFNVASQPTTSSAQAQKQATTVRLMGVRQQNLPAFTSVEADGWFDIDIIQDKHRHQLTVQGYDNIIHHLKADVKNGVLHLHMDQDYGKAEEQQIHVILRVPNLRHIRYSGHATIRAEKMETASMDVDMQESGDLRMGGKVALRRVNVGGNAKLHISDVSSEELNLKLSGSAMVDLEGKARIKEIQARDHSRLRAQWVDSPRLVAKLKDHATVNLAGKADLIVVTVCDKAHFLGKYLRAQKSFVKTYEQGLAEVNVLKSRNTLAHHDSNIYYYNDAQFEGDFMAEQGSVLDFQQMYLVNQEGKNASLRVEG